MLPVKLNSSLLNEINMLDQELSNTLNEIHKLKNSIFCGGFHFILFFKNVKLNQKKSSRKSIENHFNEFKTLSYFWSGLLKCEAQQGVEEIHYGPVLHEDEFRLNLRKLIEKNFPYEQPQIIKEEKIQYQYIEKPVTVMDNVRLAHELLFGLGFDFN